MVVRENDGRFKPEFTVSVRRPDMDMGRFISPSHKNPTTPGCEWRYFFGRSNRLGCQEHCFSARVAHEKNNPLPSFPTARNSSKTNLDSKAPAAASDS